jgi:hypothetical protein
MLLQSLASEFERHGPNNNKLFVPMICVQEDCVKRYALMTGVSARPLPLIIGHRSQIFSTNAKQTLVACFAEDRSPERNPEEIFHSQASRNFSVKQLPMVSED